MDTRLLGLVVVELGGGRTTSSDLIDHSVGLDEICRIGEQVGPDTVLATVHAATEQAAEKAAASLREIIQLGEKAPEQTPVVLERLGFEDL